MENAMDIKQKHRKNGWLLVLVLCAVLALVLIIGFKGFNWEGNNEPASAQEVLYFPNSDTDDGQLAIPLHTTLAQLSVDDGEGPIHTVVPTVPEMTFPLANKIKDQVEATLVYRPDIGGGYLLLAPAGWQAAAVVGANGSYSVTFQDPSNPEQSLNYSDNAWGCVGCAITGIGTYVPDQSEWADEMGFTIYEPLHFVEQHTIGSAGAEARTVRYTLAEDSNGYQADGAAYYDKGDQGYLFRNLEISLSVDSPQQDLVEPIMKFFTEHHGPIFISDTKEADS